MTKFRSKLKRKNGGKQWAKGQSSISNPGTTTHRAKAQSRFFQSNISLAPSGKNDSGLTFEAVLKHDAIQSYSGKTDPTVNDIAGSMKSFSINEDDMMSESNVGTFKTFQSFASNFSACSNMSFTKLINNFRPDSEVHKEMLAILAAVSEVIKEKGGAQTSTEYFLVLMETIEASKEDNDTIAAIMLLTMGMKSVPEAVLRKKFNETGELLLSLFVRFHESSNQNVQKNIIGCISVILRAQEYSSWSLSSTLVFFDAILSFVTHTRPKIRKAAQHAVGSILFGSCFVVPKKETTEDDDKPTKMVPIHPAGNRVARFCLDQFSSDNIVNNQTMILHILGLLQSVMAGFNKDDVKEVSEKLLSIMTSSNVMIRTNCFQAFHNMFAAKSNHLTSTIVGKLLSALYEYRPDKSDTRQILVWLTVMKEGHVTLVKLSPVVCMQSLPKLIEICSQELWVSDQLDVIAGTSNTIKEILYDCVKVAFESDNEISKFSTGIEKIIISLTKSLLAPFGQTANHVLVIFGVVFEVCGKHFGQQLAEALEILGKRYDDQQSLRVHIEHSVLAAIGSMDTQLVIDCIPITEKNGQVSVNRSWILPLLREGLKESTLEFFNNYILKLASQCYAKWQAFKEQKQKSEAHIYELLCCQLWGLFPGFCRNPKDIENFKLLAKTLGTVLNNNADLRAPVLDGFKELFESLKTEEDKMCVAVYAKNYMPRLFNIYTTKPSTSYENEIRESTFEVITGFLKITPHEVLKSLFDTALDQLNTKTAGTFIHDMLFDIVEALTAYQTKESVEVLYDQFILATLQREPNKKKENSLRRKLKKAYSLLADLLRSEHPGCSEFVNEKLKSIKKLVMTTSYTTVEGTQSHRLACLKLLMEKQHQLKYDSKLIKTTIPEVVSAFNNEAVVKDNIALDTLRFIGKIYEDAGKLNQFIDTLIAGLIGDSVLIANTLYVLKFVVQEYTGNMSIETLKFMVEQVLEFVVSSKRNEVTASLHFLIVFVKCLPTALVANHLTLIVKSLSLMAQDTKRHCRLTIGFLFKKLCKKFTPEVIIKMVPGSDEVSHKRLKKIRKELSRSKRKSHESKNKDDDSDAEEMENLEKKSVTIDDILADSDSDMEIENEPESADTKKKKKQQSTYIMETADQIVDLADFEAMSKLTTTQPKSVNFVEKKEYKKDKNRGFKTHADGRLIIEDIEDAESDEDEVDITGYEDQSKKRVYDEPDSDEEENEGAGASSRKKIALESNSMKSGNTGRYTTGGSGIHRPMAASVKSGYSKSSKVSTNTNQTKYGSEYKAKKAGGDLKKKGSPMEPYAYVPLSRNSLNRRKKAKQSGQFNSIVKGARKGAAAGSKNRLLKQSKRK